MANYFRKLSNSRKQDLAVCLIGLVLMMIAMLVG